MILTNTCFVAIVAIYLLSCYKKSYLDARYLWSFLSFVGTHLFSESPFKKWHWSLPYYLEFQNDSNKKSSKAYVEWRIGTPWTEEEHRWLSCSVFEDNVNHVNLIFKIMSYN